MKKGELGEVACRRKRQKFELVLRDKRGTFHFAKTGTFHLALTGFLCLLILDNPTIN